MLGSALLVGVLAGCAGSADESDEAQGESERVTAAEEQGLQPGERPTPSPGQEGLLSGETAAGSVEAFVQRDRCVNASEYAYLANASAGDEPIDGQAGPAVLEATSRRFLSVTAALAEQSPQDPRAVGLQTTA